MAALRPVTELVEMMHAFTGFCLDPAAHNHSDESRNGDYGNNFGQTVTGEGTRGAEGIFVASILGPLLRRLVRCRRELVSQENLTLYTDIRQLLHYLREIHGNTYRRSMLCSLMAIVKKSSRLVPRKSTANTSYKYSCAPTGSIRQRVSSRNNSIWLGSGSVKRSSAKEEHSDSSNSDSPKKPQKLDVDFEGGSIRRRGGLRGPARPLKTDDRSQDDGGCSTPERTDEHRWVDPVTLKEGLIDFAFLLDCSDPGTVPEPQLVASLLDLEAPVISRACLFAELSYFVNKCNQGYWSPWMKFNFPSTFVPCVKSNSHEKHGQRKSIMIQKRAGKLFHAWAEALGARGDSCPYALLSVAVQLLLEITVYLREMHQHLLAVTSGKADVSTKMSRSSINQSAKAKQAQSSRSASTGTSLRSVKRRLSTLMPIMSVEDPAAVMEDQSSVSSVYDHPPSSESLGSRRISFALLGETQRSRERSSSILNDGTTDPKRGGKGLILRGQLTSSFRRAGLQKSDSFRRSSGSRLQRLADQVEPVDETSLFKCGHELEVCHDKYTNATN
ncbi:Protein unc-80 [Cichlidogyrus casuarinus]|uniref:Protein unc-80 n=1 Tax=Cichlidogyrus casuarinus TaxID=1844966 RepID=A0ABD2QEJ7_9PLAT